MNRIQPMQKAFIGNKIIHLESVDSTNNYAAKVFREGTVDSGTVIMADIQTSGRGQRGNTWHSGAFENITMSITAAPKLWKINSLISLNHITALSLYAFIKKFVGEIKIKWPNDIMANDSKISGILIESQYSGELLQSVIGIGVNVNQKFFDGLDATSLYKETGRQFQPKELVYEYIDLFNQIVELYQKEGETYLLDRYNELLWLKNQKSTFRSEGKDFEGKIIATEKEGTLLIDVDGETKSFHNGEIIYLNKTN